MEKVMHSLKWLGLLLPLSLFVACTPISKVAEPTLRAQTVKPAPQSFQWLDRRPIGTIFLGHSPAYTPDNPRKWLNANDLNLSTEAGRRTFRDRMLNLADVSIRHMKSINAQGVVVFDIEGVEVPDNRTWVGDPRLLKERAPEMDEIADEFFQRFKSAGLRVGVTIRGQFSFPYQTPLPPKWWEKDRNLGRYWSYKTQDDAVKGIGEKIAYAKQRWGATLFYVDSNNERWPNVVARLQQQFPDVLIIPEHTNRDPAYFSSSAPLERVDYYKYDLDREKRQQQLNGFKAILLRDPNTFEKKFKISLYDYLLPRVQAGDILMLNVWYPNDRFDEVRRLYQTVYGDRCCTWNSKSRS